MNFKSILKPENSAIAGLAVVGLVYAVYSLNMGSTAEVHATDANHPVLNSSRRKAGLTSLAMVAGIGLITKDANVMILGGSAIIAMELVQRHAIMSHPQSGQLVNPNPQAAYEPAENVIPMYAQAQTG